MRGGQCSPCLAASSASGSVLEKASPIQLYSVSYEASMEAPCKFLLRKYGSLCFKSLLPSPATSDV